MSVGSGLISHFRVQFLLTSAVVVTPEIRGATAPSPPAGKARALRISERARKGKTFLALPKVGEIAGRRWQPATRGRLLPIIQSCTHSGPRGRRYRAFASCFIAFLPSCFLAILLTTND